MDIFPNAFFFLNNNLDFIYILLWIFTNLYCLVPAGGNSSLAVSRWMLESIKDLCDIESQHLDSPWTCPKLRVTFYASVISYRGLDWTSMSVWLGRIVQELGIVKNRGTCLNYFTFKYRKGWWQRYNYVLSAALDAGTEFIQR